MLALDSRLSIGSSSIDGALGPVEHQLGRAHRRAARRRGQDPVAVTGEEDGVDQLRLAARKLGDEGHMQAIFAQLLEQLSDAPVGLGVAQLVLDQPAGKFFKHPGELARHSL
jgi:hypothetical protein